MSFKTSSKVHLNDTESKRLTRCFSGDTTPLFMRSSTPPSAFSSRVAPWLATAYLGGLSAVLPLTPLFASLLFGQWKYLRDYAGFIKKMRIHISALREGPALHYFEDVMGRASEVPADITGSCVQCGNCCMDKRCVFLEPISDGRYQCGIYHSPFRRWSNCGSFPLNAHDIARYACPSYQVVHLVRKPD